MKQQALTYKKASEEDTKFLLRLRKETMVEHLNSAGMEVDEKNF